MDTVTWVHLSDWHQRGVDFDRRVVRDALLRDLRQRHCNISADLVKVDFVVFSGDLAFSGKREEYRVALHEFITPVLQACDLVHDGKPLFDRFFLVPGNHDVDRELISLLRTDIRVLSKRETLLNILGNDDARAMILGPLKAYADFVRGDLNGAGCGQCTDYGFQARFDVSGKSISIVGLNSAWLCGTNRESGGDVDDYGNIIAGEMQLDHALRNSQTSDLVIGLLHHPFSWLGLKNGVDDRVKIRNRLMSECHVILHGHEHEPAVSVQSSTYGNCVIIPCGSAYDRRDPGVSMYANGYNLCTVDLASNEGRAFLRRFDGDRLWHPDVRTSRPNADGSFVFQIPLKTQEESPSIAKTSRSFPSKPDVPLRSTNVLDSTPILVTSANPESVRTLPSDVLRETTGGISVSVYVSPFGSGIRRLVNNRYIIAHAVSALDPYSNVVSLSHGPRKFSGEDIEAPAWKVWLVNDTGVSRLLRVDDTEQISVGWHNFILRWNHEKPLLELLLDGRGVIAEPNYAEAWPTRFTTDISLGSWPKRWAEHYVDTCIARWQILDQPFEEGVIADQVGALDSLPACAHPGAE